MPAHFVAGDLFRHPGLHALAHGCNCAGAMGKGIAAEFRDHYPKMFAEYKRRCADGRFALGDVFAWVEGGLTIYNLGTQKTWRSGAVMSAIETATTAMVRLAEQASIATIGLPRIGAGLGGLPWPEIRAFLGALGARTAVDLIVIETFAPS